MAKVNLLSIEDLIHHYYQNIKNELIFYSVFYYPSSVLYEHSFIVVSCVRFNYKIAYENDQWKRICEELKHLSFRSLSRKIQF